MALVKVYTALPDREGRYVFDWPGNSAILTQIEEVWTIIKKEKKKKSGKFLNNKKKALE